MYLVTGATGHLGNTLIRHLLQREPDCQIRAFVLPHSDQASLAGLPVEIMEGNVLDPSSLDRAMAGIDLVFHLAAIISIVTYQDEMTERVNVQGVENVAKAALRAGVRRMIHVASIHIFERLETGRIDETVPLVVKETAAGIYDYTKAEGVRRLFKLIDEQGLDVTILCPTGVIGPNDYLGSQMGNAFDRFLGEGRAIAVRGCYNWVDVRDVAQSIYEAATRGRTGELYLLGGHPMGMEHFAEHVSQAINRPVRTIMLPDFLVWAVAYTLDFLTWAFNMKPSLTPYSVRTLRDNIDFDYSKAIEELGHSPRAPQETVADMVAWYGREKEEE